MFYCCVDSLSSSACADSSASGSTSWTIKVPMPNSEPESRVIRLCQDCCAAAVSRCLCVFALPSSACPSVPLALFVFLFCLQRFIIYVFVSLYVRMLKDVCVITYALTVSGKSGFPRVCLEIINLSVGQKSRRRDRAASSPVRRDPSLVRSTLGI